MKLSIPEDDFSTLPAGAQVVVAKNTCAPRNKDTEYILKLIGSKLTRFELRSDSSILLEFGEDGCIVIEPRFGMNITASTAASISPIAHG